MISVIVPIYNTEKYIYNCVSSILNQTYKDLEVILVDDGSTDNSPKIIDGFLNDKRVSIYHKKNGGQGSARNLALNFAKGDYISFVDSDDELLPTAYDDLLSLINLYDADMAITDSFYFSTDIEKEKINIINEKYSNGLLTNIEAMNERFVTNKIVTDSPCNKLFKKQLFNDLRFAENILFEDTDLMYQVIDKCKKIAYTNKKCYLVRCDNCSVSRRKYSVNRCDAFTIYMKIREFFKKSNDYNNLVPNLESIIAGTIFYNAGEIFKMKKVDKQAKIKIKKYAKALLECQKNLSYKNKILLNLIIRCYFIFGLLYIIKH